MSELDNCCGTTCDKQKLAEEINALNAKVEQLRNEWEKKDGHELSAKQKLEKLVAIIYATPFQCLAEIQAQAGHAGFLEATAIDWNQYSEDEIKEAAEEYANKIRQAAKVGDL